MFHGLHIFIRLVQWVSSFDAEGEVQGPTKSPVVREGHCEVLLIGEILNTLYLGTEVGKSTS